MPVHGREDEPRFVARQALGAKDWLSSETTRNQLDVPAYHEMAFVAHCRILYSWFPNIEKRRYRSDPFSPQVGDSRLDPVIVNQLDGEMLLPISAQLWRATCLLP
jgi:hypothetical protein